MNLGYANVIRRSHAGSSVRIMFASRRRAYRRRHGVDPWWARDVGGMPVWAVIVSALVIVGLLAFVLYRNFA